MPPLIKDLLRRLSTREFEREELVEALDTALGIAPGIVHAATVLTAPLVDDQQWRLGSRRCRSTLVWRTASALKLEVKSRHDPDDAETEQRYSVFGIRHESRPAVVTLLSFQDPAGFRDGIRRLVRFNKRDLILASLSDKRFRAIVEAYPAAEAFDELLVRRASVKLRANPRQGRHQIGFSSVAWPQSSLEQAFQWVWDNNGWFVNLTFSAFRAGHEIGRFGLGRRGEVSSSHRFSSAFRSLCIPVGLTFEQDERFFGRRARRELQFHQTRPLVIDYGRGVFAEPEMVRQFVAALRLFPHGPVSVYHGNPYLHAAVLDHVDGSSMEVWVASANRVLVVPQMRATVWGLKRVVQHIYDSFGEGDLADYEPSA
jgi:hypothetical protein